MPAASPILSSQPGSFPWKVLHDRHPALIEQVRRGLPYGPGIQRNLDALLTETTAGVIEPLPTTAADGPVWSDWAGGYFGRSWYDVPFLWAESYFYRRLLDAVEYFTPGPWRGVDPFEPAKAAELAALAPDADLDDAQALLLSAVWGNRADLGFRLQGGALGRVDSDPLAAGLIADDSHQLWTALNDHPPGRVTLVADNAGRELMSDLLLIDHLLANDLAEQVALHLKPVPYYVSDACTPDLVACLRALSGSGEQGQDAAVRLHRAAADGTIQVMTHDFYCAPLSFHQMPADLAADFAASGLTLFKGDLNYRRLVGDCDWPPSTSFADVVEYFPGPVGVLRTLKCDVIVGLDDDTVDGLDATGEAWRTSGTHAVVQARL